MSLTKRVPFFFLAATVPLATILALVWFSSSNLPNTEVLIPSTSRPFDSSGLRIVALGDSYTAGHGVQAHERWPIQLALRLERLRFAVAEPTFIASSGWTTTNLSSGIREFKNGTSFDLVLLMIGVNDQYHGATVEDFRAAYAITLKEAMGLAGGNPKKVLAIEVPDWSATPFVESKDKLPTRAKVDAFNQVIAEVCDRSKVMVVPMGDVSREVAKSPNRLLYRDQLHPNGITYAHWADYILPFVVERLNNR